jgi:hypothetical protein
MNLVWRETELASQAWRSERLLGDPGFGLAIIHLIMHQFPLNF